MLRRVLTRSHKEALGEAVQVEVLVPDNEEPIVFQAPNPSVDQAPIKISVDSKIAIAIHTCSSKLDKFVESLGTSMELQLDHIVVTPSEKSCIDWKEKCEGFLEKTFSKCIITVPNEIRKEMKKKFKECKKSNAFMCEHESDTHESTSYILAGEVESLQILQKYCEEIKNETKEELEVTGEQYDFLKQFNRLEEFKSKYPTVSVTLDINSRFILSLKGPQLYVKQLKQELEEITQDLKLIPITGLDTKLINHFSKPEGRKQIKEFIKLKECPMAVTFKCREHEINDKLSLLFVCESKYEQWASSIPKELVKSAKYEEIQIPDYLASKLEETKDFMTLVSKLRANHGTVVVPVDSIITVFGFSDSVATSVKELDSYFAEEVTSSTPLTFSVSSELVCRALKKRPQDLEQTLAHFSPKVSHSFSKYDETKILVTSKTSMERDWKQRCKTILTQYTSQFCEIQVSFSKDSAQEVSKYLTRIEKSSKAPFAFDMQSDVVDIAGTTIIFDFETKVGELSCSFTNISKEFQLHPPVYAYISQVKLTNMLIKHPDLSLILNGTTLTASGPRDKVIQFDEVFKQNYSTFSSVEATKDPVIAEFLSDGHGKEFLTTFVKTNKALVATFFNKNSSSQILSLCFLCDPKDDASVLKLIAALKEKVVVGTIPLPESLKKPKQPLISSFSNCYKKIENECHVICSVSTLKSEICFTGLATDIQNAIKLMNDFLANECTIVKEIELSRLEWKLIKKDKRWTQSINNQLISSVKPDKNGSQVTILLKGDELDVTMNYATLKEMKDSIKTESITVLAPGACKYFQEDTTTATTIPGVEHTYNVCIETSILENTESDASVDNIFTTTNAKEYCRAISPVFAKNNIVTFKVYIGDITDFQADVIVNAANGDLQHSGGLPKAIVNKGGQEIQNSCNQFIDARMHPLGEGDVHFSLITGKLPCKAIVHAVGPIWRENSKAHDYEKNHLALAVRNTLHKSRQYHSIAFPAISSGIYNYPIKECALVHVQAAMLFFRSEKANLQDISFVVLHQNHAMEFRNAFCQCFSGERVFDSETNTCMINLPNQLAVSCKTLSGAATTKPEVKRLPHLHHGDLFSTKVISHLN